MGEVRGLAMPGCSPPWLHKAVVHFALPRSICIRGRMVHYSINLRERAERRVGRPPLRSSASLW